MAFFTSCKTLLSNTRTNKHSKNEKKETRDNASTAALVEQACHVSIQLDNFAHS